jgi:hypothetical protein
MYTLSLHDALPIYIAERVLFRTTVGRGMVVFSGADETTRARTDSIANPIHPMR